MIYFIAAFAAALFNAQRFFVAAEIAARPARLNFRLGLGASCEAGADCFFDAAHRFRCASAIALLPAALIFRRLRVVVGSDGVVAGSVFEPPDRKARSSAIWASIRVFCAS